MNTSLVRIVGTKRLRENMLILRIFSKFLVFAIGILIALNSFPIFAFASTGDSKHDADFQVAGWIPYWNHTNGIKDAKKNLKKIDVVYPFSFEVQSDGTLKDKADMQKSEWKKFIASAKKAKVEVIPSVIWFDGGMIHANLSYPELRKKHIAEIIQMVDEGNYNGVNIDYESKLSSTKDHFSAFLTELKEELGDGRTLACTIEARTPPASLYKDIPKTILYANDFKVIGKVCDTVEIMTYDQQRADIKLNEARLGEPYMPVSDVAWVEKVIKLALEDIPAEKILLGVPSYGHHYTVTVAPNWYRDYTKVGALNMPDMLDVAKEYKVKPVRNSAGEMGFSYMPKSFNFKFPKNISVPKNTPSANKVALQALMYANKTGQEVRFNYASYSDAGAMQAKIKLAKEYELRGVAFFKFDGEEDQKIWKALQ